MKIEDEILLNKYGQGLIGFNELQHDFFSLDLIEKRRYLSDLTNMIIQSKANNNDVMPAIIASGLKETFTPCVMLLRGVMLHNIEKIIDLPENELSKTHVLLLSLFKLAYKRRYEVEKNDPNKWWYWDLSDNEKLRLIKRDH